MMDPSTTLVTFLFQTEPSVQTVELIGSWDNFSSHYPMERDWRRGPGQWKGCHLFRDIICNGDLSKTRHGGLQMGHTYYYYYEVDGSTETHDENMPSTTSCPYMPGQRVNALTIPTQQSLRQRSVSLSSMRITDYTTMNPDAKFLPPQPILPMVSEAAASSGKRSAPGILRTAAPRSRSPSPAWKRFFHGKSRDDERGRSPNRDEDNLRPTTAGDDGRSVASSGSRNRSISPESLRRFLTDDSVSSRPGSNRSERPALVIPEDIAEENEDDDNFATSPTYEDGESPFSVGLSPPPVQRPVPTRETTPLTSKNLSSLTLSTACPPSRDQDTKGNGNIVLSAVGKVMPTIELPSQPPSATLTSAASSAVASPLSVGLPDDAMLTFFDDSNDDDDEEGISSNEMELPMPRQVTSLRSRFTGYSLPPQATDKRKSYLQPSGARLNPPTMMLGAGSLNPTDASKVLLSPVDTGLDDFVDELGFIVDTIGTRNA